MLLSPRTFAQSRIPDRGHKEPASSYFVCTQSVDDKRTELVQASRMLLVHQAGSVRVGEVVRYTLTYTPSADRILPSPTQLHVRIKNTSAAPLRAAYLHGPYNIHVSAHPFGFDPNHKLETTKSHGAPQFEPNLKAGGSWSAKLPVPEEMRESGGRQETRNDTIAGPKGITWILEISSQILFSATASVNFELRVARDERSLDVGFLSPVSSTHGDPGQVQDFVGKREQGHRHHRSASQQRGVYSKAVKLTVEDTAALWDKPSLADLDAAYQRSRKSVDTDGKATANRPKPMKKQKVHLVILTHGLHSNTGADLLYLKESIDVSAKKAREDAKERKRKRKQSVDDKARTNSTNILETDYQTTGLAESEIKDEDHLAEDSDTDDDELVVVRGYHNNAVRTERGIPFLGKRLAKYVLELTYPDQPFLPIKQSVAMKITHSLSPTKPRSDGIAAHPGSTVQHPENDDQERGFVFTSISFIGHSLGGLIQTYAMAYIHKHSPGFFDKIKPVNFVALASPLLGLSNENPMYVKFALDFGLVGRTGQDLGLTWRAPTLARSGWSAMVGGLGVGGTKESKNEDPGSKPLLRVLPTGPAHEVLRMFRNRTVYSNVVNDGIVPLRTSCLLFLDWRGLGKVEKARRENGIIGTVAGWGWGQLTGQNTPLNPSQAGGLGIEATPQPKPVSRDESPSGMSDTEVPQPGEDITNLDDGAEAAGLPGPIQFLESRKHAPKDGDKSAASSQGTSTLSGFLNFFRPHSSNTTKDNKPFRRGQVVNSPDPNVDSSGTAPSSPSDDQTPPKSSKRPQATRGDSIANDPSSSAAPPRTTIFESAGDLLNPPVPPLSWVVDPTTRARTIFHDRVYHPEDIPSPPSAKRPGRFVRSFSSEGSFSSVRTDTSSEELTGIKVEEKIARAYHRDLSWRKVLVRLEPDAHNNIIVRRMFANAYGWPVVRHLCDTHFADTFSARTRDEREPAIDRAKGIEKPSADGTEVDGQTDPRAPVRSNSEMREAMDELSPLPISQTSTDLLDNNILSHSSHQSQHHRHDSSSWDDIYFDVTSDDDDEIPDNRFAIQKFLSPTPRPRRTPSETHRSSISNADPSAGTSDVEIQNFLNGGPQQPPQIEGHRGLAPVVSPQSTTFPPSSNQQRPVSPPDADSDDQFSRTELTESSVDLSNRLSHHIDLTNIGLRRPFDEPPASSPIDPAMEPITQEQTESQTSTSGSSSYVQPPHLKRGESVAQQVARLSFSPTREANISAGTSEGADVGASDSIKADSEQNEAQNSSGGKGSVATT